MPLGAAIVPPPSTWAVTVASAVENMWVSSMPERGQQRDAQGLRVRLDVVGGEARPVEVVVREDADRAAGARQRRSPPTSVVTLVLSSALTVTEPVATPSENCSASCAA